MPTESEFWERLAMARTGNAPFQQMRLRHWTTGPSRGLRGALLGTNPLSMAIGWAGEVPAPPGWEHGQPWIALYPVDALPGDPPLVVVSVLTDPGIDGVEQGAVVSVWGWPVVGDAVHINYDDRSITAAGPCDRWMIRRMPEF